MTDEGQNLPLFRMVEEDENQKRLLTNSWNWTYLPS